MYMSEVHVRDYLLIFYEPNNETKKHYLKVKVFNYFVHIDHSNFIAITSRPFICFLVRAIMNLHVLHSKAERFRLTGRKYDFPIRGMKEQRLCQSAFISFIWRLRYNFAKLQKLIHLYAI